MLQKYAVVDIEATGGTQKVDRIIEIGIVLIDGEEITSTFSSLVRPGISIPPFITKLTGISNKMVADSPQFHEIARTIVEMTEGRSLVAHNVSFDYRILREEFDRLGYEFKSDTLCTARLSRHYFPDIDKYNLASVAKALNLDLADRHRAGDDAMATAQIMLQILNKSRGAGLSLKNMSIYKSKSRLPDNIQEEQILDLPNVCGVYYMLDADNEPLYIGKSIKIRTRIRAHFTEETSKTQKMQKLVHAIRYENTGSELMAEIHESLEIRKFKPLLNRAKRKTKFENALIETMDGDYKSFKIKHKSRVRQNDNTLQWFSSKNAAKAYISGLVQNYELCACLCGVNSSSKDCTTYKIGHCLGAQLGHEDAMEYNLRYDQAHAMSDRLFNERMMILDKGRTKDEFSAFYISDNRVSHIGYLPMGVAQSKDESKILKLLKPIKHNAEIDRILYRYFYLRKYERKIEFNSTLKEVEGK
jgi:DNA polymerase-3 subunit epsilon